MRRRTRFVGLDAHMATIAVAVADDDSSVEEYGSIANDPSAVRKMVARLSCADARLKVAYEAGPTGYADRIRAEGTWQPLRLTPSRGSHDRRRRATAYGSTEG